MLRRWLVFATLLVAPACAAVRDVPKPVPIILVHGFAGWGRDELAGYLYWGGSGLDIERFLDKLGFPTATASVSPIASNHDRACQLYAQIKGGRVDFGDEHSRRHGHARFGRTYARPLYPWWSERHPLHFVGHSMGGQTIRVLIDLLERGHFGPGANARWVLSCTTISTPHNGSTLTELSKTNPAGWTQKVMAGILKLAGSHWPDYDLDLDHWGIQRRAGETWEVAWASATRGLADTKDFSFWDLHPAGARELNARTGTHPDVFFLTWSNEETFRMPLAGRQLPSPQMDPWMMPFALFMGNHASEAVRLAPAWLENDGIVNTVSMTAPAGAPWRVFDGRAVHRGTFNYMGRIAGKDHLKVVGHYQDPVITGRWLRPFYLALARNLWRISAVPRTQRAVLVESAPHP
jgi:triacylglycerol lipase